MPKKKQYRTPSLPYNRSGSVANVANRPSLIILLRRDPVQRYVGQHSNEHGDDSNNVKQVPR
jgi:hypothetical protein